MNIIKNTSLFLICCTSVFGNTEVQQIKNNEKSINLDSWLKNPNITIIGNPENPIIHIPKGVTEIREKISINSNGVGIITELSQFSKDTPTQIGISILKGPEPNRLPHDYVCVETSDNGKFQGFSHFNPDSYPSTHTNYPVNTAEFFIKKSKDSDLYLKNLSLIELTSSDIKKLKSLEPFNTYNSFEYIKNLNRHTKRLLFNSHSFKIEDYLASKKSLKNDEISITPPWEINENKISLKSFSDNYSTHITIKTPLEKEYYSYAFQANVDIDYVPVSGLNQHLTISAIPVSNTEKETQINKLNLARITYTPHPITINSIFKVSKEYKNLNNLEIIIAAYNIFGKINIKDVKIIPLSQKETNELLDIVSTINPKIPEKMSLPYIMRNIKYIHAVWTSRDTLEMSEKQKAVHKLQYYTKQSDLELKRIVKDLSISEIHKKLEEYDSIKTLKLRKEKEQSAKKIKDLLINIKK